MSGAKKKRDYAAGAYEFGANAPGNAPAPAPIGMGAAPGDIAGQMGQMNLGSPGLQNTGYQPPQPGYQQPAYQQPAVSDRLKRIAWGSALAEYQQSNRSQGVQQVAAQAPVTAHLNQLFPSDLVQRKKSYSNQSLRADAGLEPFNVLELDQPPPPM